MKNTFIIILFILFGFSTYSQDVTGMWKNTNEKGQVNSIIEVYKKDNKVFGRVDHIISEEDRDRICTKCEGDLKNEPVQGMIIMRGLEKDGDKYVDGTIVDPKTGKEYRCKIWLEEDNPDILNIRGYIAFFYKTKTWRRAE